MQGRVEHLERPAASDAAGALVFFHGFYGIPDDFVPFMDKLDPERRLHAFLPKARFEIDAGRASWFDPAGERRDLADLDPVAAWLDALPFAADRRVLGGWSQGAMVAYALGLGAGRPRPAGIVALGGALRPEVELSADAAVVPVVIGHGRADDAVPVDDARASRDRLRAAGNEPLYLETDVGHRIDQAVVPRLREFVASVV